MKNNWEKSIDTTKYKEKKNFNLEMLYKQAHSELSLQQSKRDQIITIYLALCSFLIPFALGEALISWNMKGLIFLAISVIGVIFSFICIRYRIYKEAYWLCCQSLTVLMNFREEELDKETVQQVFYYSLCKKGRGYCKTRHGKTKFDKLSYFKKNLFSAETLHFLIIAFMSSFIFALGLSLLITLDGFAKLAICALGGFILLLLLLYCYFEECIRIYSFQAFDDTMKDEKNRRFNKVFGKAWFLHFYY